MRSKTNLLLIKTPEGIVFSQSLAGPVTRFLAWVIDFMAIAVLLMIFGYLTVLLQLISADLASAAAVLGYFGVSIGYGIVCEWFWRGQPVGKKLFRLRVVDAQGLRLHISQIVIRNLLRFIDSLPVLYFVGGCASWFSGKSQRLGDLAANTIVIRNPKIAQPNLDQLLAGKYNSLQQYPHLEARLRQRVSPAEAAIALQALLRRDELDLYARLELFRDLAAHFRSKVEFPPEATDGITNEQYIRNVADVLYRTRTGAKLENVAA